VVEVVIEEGEEVSEVEVAAIEEDVVDLVEEVSCLRTFYNGTSYMGGHVRDLKGGFIDVGALANFTNKAVAEEAVIEEDVEVLEVEVVTEDEEEEEEEELHEEGEVVVQREAQRPLS
jgi:hypothetical protein